MKASTSGIRQTVDLVLTDLDETDVSTLILISEAGLEKIQASAPGMGIGGFNRDTANETIRALRLARSKLKGKDDLVKRQATENAVAATA